MRISDWSSDVCSSDLALPPDEYLLAGGSYRRRRHSGFVVDDARLERAPHRAHWQSKDCNALHGGLRRWFEPVSDAVANSPAWSRLLLGLSTQVSRLHDARPWHVEAHQFRIDTSDGLGRPTPARAHRDGVETGSAPCRERMCRYAEFSVVAVTKKKKK